jgi:hypothetical protein
VTIGPLLTDATVISTFDEGCVDVACEVDAVLVPSDGVDGLELQPVATIARTISDRSIRDIDLLNDLLFI